MTAVAPLPVRPPVPVGERLRRNGAVVGRRVKRVVAAWPRFTARIGAAIAVAALLVIATALILDARAAAWVATWHSPAVAFFSRVTRFGQSDWLLIPSGVGALILMLGAWQRVDRHVAAAWTEVGTLLGAFFVVVAGSGISVDIVKAIVGRERPPLFEHDGPFAFVPFTIDYLTNSFPSGHATTMGAVIVFAGSLSSNLIAPALILGLTVAVSRVLVQAHYASDVVAGLLFGGSYAYALVIALARARVGFRFDAGGRPRPQAAGLRWVARNGGPVALWSGLWSALRGR